MREKNYILRRAELHIKYKLFDVRNSLSLFNVTSREYIRPRLRGGGSISIFHPSEADRLQLVAACATPIDTRVYTLPGQYSVSWSFPNG